MVNWPLPTTIEEGEMLAIAGMGVPGAKVVKVTAFDTPPPGPGLNTVMASVSGETMSEAGMLAVSWVLEIKLVVLMAPSNRTSEPDMKLVPFTVRVNPGSPAVLDEGDMLTIVGTG